MREYLAHLLIDLAETDTNVVLLAILLVAAVIVLDAVSLAAKESKEDTGLLPEEGSSAFRSMPTLPLKTYVSEKQGISGRPDALLQEDGFIIPVERKPFARKIRDRYVAQLLVYLRLVEEFEGQRPPYGYLILGKSCRRVKIHNTEARQRWLQKHLDEMNRIMAEKMIAYPAPHPQKCKKCPVRMHCSAADNLIRPSEQRTLCAIGSET